MALYFAVRAAFSARPETPRRREPRSTPTGGTIMAPDSNAVHADAA